MKKDRKIKAYGVAARTVSDLFAAALLPAMCLLAQAPPLRAQTRDDYCGTQWPQSLQSQWTERAVMGRYVNSSYGYSVRVPAGQHILTPRQGPERGFLLVLSEQPRAFIRVDASYDVFYDITPEGVHRRDLNTLRLHDTLLGEQSAATRLAGEPAHRSRIRLSCRGSSSEWVHEAILAVRRREIYRLDLQTTPDRLDGDARVFNALEKSWRWEIVR